MPEYSKPLPRPDEDSESFWAGCHDHELRMQRCRQCGYVRFRPRPVCPHCLSEESEWVPLSGHGTVYSYVVVRSPMMPAFSADVPYVLALIDLDEGPRMTSNIVGCAPEDVEVGMPVEVVYEDVTPQVSLPKFRRAG